MLPISNKEPAANSVEMALTRNLMQLDRDVFAVAIFGFSGKLEAYVAKDFFTKEHRNESSIWEKAALRHAAIVKLANEGELESSASGIVFFRKEFKQILIPVASRKIIIEAVMPLWNHSTVFFEGVHKFFASKSIEQTVNSS